MMADRVPGGLCLAFGLVAGGALCLVWFVRIGSRLSIFTSPWYHV